MERKCLRGNIYILAATVLLLVVFGNLKQANAQEEEAQRIGQEITAGGLIRAAIEKLEQQSLDEEALEERILKTPSEHQSRTRSEILLRNWSKEQLTLSFLAALKKSRSDVNKDKEWITPERFNEIVNRFEKERDAAIQRVLAEKFPESFQQARDSAVKKQWQRIKTNIYPKPTEVEAIAQKDEAKKSIKAKLREKMAKQIILFEENDRNLEQVMDSNINHALKQLQGQRYVLMDSKIAGITEIVIQKNLQEELKNFIEAENQRAQEGQKIYGVFPSVSQAIPQRSKELMKERFLNYASSDEIYSFIDVSELRDLITGNLKEHRESEQSLKIVQQKLKPRIKKKIIVAYSEKAKKEAGKSFSEEFQKLLDEDANIKAAYEKKLRQCLDDYTETVREQIASQQLLKYFKKIASKEWEPPEKRIRQYRKEHKAEINDLLQNKESILLQETVQKLRDDVDEILKEGVRAVDAQGIVIDRHKESIESQIRSDKKRNPPEYWINLYLRQVKSEWERERIRLIWGNQPQEPYMQKKYPKLFEETVTRIKEIIAKFFQQIEKVEKEKELESRLIRQGGGSKGSPGMGGGSGGSGQGAGGGSGTLAPVPPSKNWFWWILLGSILLLLICLIIWWHFKKKGVIILKVREDGTILRYRRRKISLEKAKALLESALSKI